jgi:hypothetical protein
MNMYTILGCHVTLYTSGLSISFETLTHTLLGGQIKCFNLISFCPKVELIKHLEIQMKQLIMYNINMEIVI